MRYFGTVTHRLDNKNRLTIPSTFLDKLGSRVYLTKNHNNFLELRDEEVFASFTKNLSKTIKNPSELSMFKRMFFKNTIELKIDSSNRILIKEDLKSFLNITNEISFVGVGEKIELWNSIELAKYEKEMVKKYSEISDSITEEGGSRKS